MSLGVDLDIPTSNNEDMRLFPAIGAIEFVPGRCTGLRPGSKVVSSSSFRTKAMTLAQCLTHHEASS
jgi:hypothetical protein